MRIKNWEKFQHFKDRKPPWIKLYRDLLDDPDWFDLDDKSSKVLVMLWLLASEDEGSLPSVKKLSFRLRMKEGDINQTLTKLSHWVEQDDITMISSRYQDDAPETETETEKRQRYGEFQNVILKTEEHEKLQAKLNGKCSEFIERLSRYIAQSGKKYKSHYATILNWHEKEASVSPQQQPLTLRQQIFQKAVAEIADAK